jgi:hypothetical protein
VIEQPAPEQIAPKPPMPEPVSPQQVATSTVTVSEPAPKPERPFRIEAGVIEWTEFFGEGQGIATAGISLDLWQNCFGGSLSVYADTAGILQSHPTYRFFGGGVEYRQFLSNSSTLKPYVGVGGGYYHLNVHDLSNQGTDRFGGKAFAGLELKNGLFLEAAFNYFGRNRDRDLSRFGLSLGYRF